MAIPGKRDNHQTSKITAFPSETIMPDPVLVGRNEDKLRKLGEMSGVTNYTTDLDSVLQNPDYTVYFDSQTTVRRVAAVKQAVDAG